MFDRKLILAMCVALMALIPSAFAQVPPTPAAEQPKAATATADSDQIPEGGIPGWIDPETPEHRRDRIGGEDPGPNPDLNKHFWRFGKSYHIERMDRRWASFDDVEPGRVRGFAFVNVSSELYQMNDKYVWVWVQDVSKEELEAPVANPSRYTDRQIDYFKKIRTDFFELTPKGSNT